MAQKLSSGDLVEWKGWFLTKDGDCTHETYRGILIEIEEQAIGGRDVLYGKVLPIGNDIIFEINVFCLRKVSEKETN